MFDLQTIRKESGLSEQALAILERKIREEFQEDELMFEIHLVRAVYALKQGWITAEALMRDAVEA